MPAKRPHASGDQSDRAKRLRTEAGAVSKPSDRQTDAGESRDADGARQDAAMDEGEGDGAAGRETGSGTAAGIPDGGPPRPRHRIRKLAAPRPFPAVPASVSATGPRSAHAAGKNCICVTRRTPLGAYLRRCRDVFLQDGYRTLRLSAMGAAVPHLMLLALSLPPILPFAADEVRTEVLTGTVEVQDEVVPDDEDEDISYQTRGKSTVSVVIRVGDGVDEVIRRGKGRGNGKGKGKQAGVGVGASSGKSGADEGASATRQVVIREEELDHSE